MNQGINVMPRDFPPTNLTSSQAAVRYNNPAAATGIPYNNGGVPGDGGGVDHRIGRGGVPTSSSSPPPPLHHEYNTRQQHLQQHHQPMHTQSPPPRLPQVPLHIGGNNSTMDMMGTASITTTATDPSNMPWTVGSTDGSYATMTLMQQKQQIEAEKKSSDNVVPNYQIDPSSGSTIRTSSDNKLNGVGGATIGAAGEANTTTGTSTTASMNDQNHSISAALAAIQNGQSLYHDRLFHQSSSSVESVLSSSCEVMGFDIAEMWLRTGPKTHQLTNSHLRPTALEDSVRRDLVEVYYGDKSAERTHRLSPALCKRAKDANDVVWVTAYTPHGAEALRMSISNVRTAVAVPVCHEASNTNITIIYFSIRRIMMRPAPVEFLVHMSLCAAVASVNSLATDGLVDPARNLLGQIDGLPKTADNTGSAGQSLLSRSEHIGGSNEGIKSGGIVHHRVDHVSITGARLDMQWRQLQNVEYLTDGGNSWIHTAVFNGKPVVVKTLKPECQDVALAINEIESELAVHSRLNHPHIVALIGAGLTSKGVRFIVLERLDGGTLTQMLGYDTRIRDRRRRFWRKKQLAYLEVLRCARSLASAMQYCHEEAIPGSMVLHRDLKPDNIGFTIDSSMKLMDFGLARILENANPKSNELYTMSGETGSLRYMAPEIAESLPYNHKADVYSFGIILWELNTGKKPFVGLNRESFYERIVHGGERPPMNKKWPSELCKLLDDCWNADIDSRPTFGEIVERIDALLVKEKGGGKSSGPLKRISGLIDRHSTWF